MFDFFRRRTAKEFMEEAKETYQVPPIPEVKTPESNPTVCYSVGPTDDNRVSLTVGWSTITMNQKGCQALIDALSVAMNNLEEETEEDVQEHN